MKKRIITISREFGSGGRTVGKQLAEKLGVDYYDKELVKQIASASGFAPAYVEEHSDYARGRSAFSYGLFQSGGSGLLSAEDYLWCVQRGVILDLAEKAPCVIVGRCADYILREREDCLHAFLHADKAFRAERIVRLYGESEKAPEKRLDEKDSRRRVSYKHFTGGDWGMSQNYHISLSTSALGLETCVEILAELFQKES